MRPCTLRIASAEKTVKATSLTTSSSNTLLGAEPPQPHSQYTSSLGRFIVPPDPRRATKRAEPTEEDRHEPGC